MELKPTTILLHLPEKTRPDVWEPVFQKAGHEIILVSSLQELTGALGTTGLGMVAAPASIGREDVVSLLRDECESRNIGPLPGVFFLDRSSDPSVVGGTRLQILRYFPAPWFAFDVVNSIALYQVERELVNVVRESLPGQGFLRLNDKNPLTKVIERFERRNFSGLLTCYHEGLFGHLVMKDGQVVEAISHLLQGNAALYRMLPWSNGIVWPQGTGLYHSQRPLKAGTVTAEFMEQCRQRAQKMSRALGGQNPENLVVEPIVSEEQLRQAITTTMGAPYVESIINSQSLLELLQTNYRDDVSFVEQLKGLERREFVKIAPLDTEEGISIQMPLSLAIEEALGSFEDAAPEMVNPKLTQVITTNVDTNAALQKVNSFLEFLTEVILDTPNADLRGEGFEGKASILSMYLGQIMDAFGELNFIYDESQPELLAMLSGHVLAIRNNRLFRLFAQFGLDSLTFMGSNSNSIARFCRALAENRAQPWQLNYEDLFESQGIHGVQAVGGISKADFQKRFGAGTGEAPPTQLTAGGQDARTPIHQPKPQPQRAGSQRPSLASRPDEEEDDLDMDEAIYQPRNLGPTLHSETVSQIVSRSDFEFNSWKDIQDLIATPRDLIEAVYDHHFKMVRLMLRHAEDSDVKEGRSFSLKQLWTLVEDFHEVERAMMSVDALPEAERLQAFQLLTDVLDPVTKGEVMGMGIDYYGWRSAYKAVLRILEGNDLERAFVGWYNRAQILFRKQSRVGRMVLHRRMRLHVAVLMNTRPDFDLVLQHLSEKKVEFGLEPLDLAIFAGKTPAEFNIDSRVIKIVTQPIRSYTEPATVEAVMPLFGEFLQDSEGLEFQTLIFFFISLLRHPVSQVRLMAIALLSDFCRLTIVTGKEELFTGTLSVIQERLSAERSPEVLEGGVKYLQRLLEVANGKNLETHVKSLMRLFMKLLDENRGLDKDQRKTIVESTSTLNIDMVLEQLLDDLDHPDRWDSAAEFLKLHGDRARPKLLLKLFHTESHSTRTRILDVLKTVGVEVTPMLLDHAKDPREVNRKALVTLLGYTNDTASRQLLLRMLEDESPDVRIEVLTSLAANADEYTERLLMKRFEDEKDHRVRSRILTALQECASEWAVSQIQPYFERRMFGRDEIGDQLRQDMCGLLGAIGSPLAVPILTDVLKPKGLFGGGGFSVPVQMSALMALAKFPSNENKRLMNRIKADATEPKLRMAATRALDEMEGKRGKK